MLAAESAVEIPAAEVAQIVESVFSTMLGLAVAADGASWMPGEDRLTAAVHMAGDWNGAVLLECTRRQACRIAGRFLSMETPAAVDDVVRDVLGELANMIGGNMKCVLIPGIRLSMPCVVDGSDYGVRICGATMRERLGFDCDDGTFWITVLDTRS